MNENESIAIRAIALEERKFAHQTRMDEALLELQQRQHNTHMDEALLKILQRQQNKEFTEAKEIKDVDKEPRVFTKIIIESTYNIATVEINKYGLLFPAFVEELLRPALLAFGYQAETIDEYFGTTNEYK